MSQYNFILFFSFISLFISCSSEQKNISGETLSQIHCSSCHVYPSPTLLDKKSWDKHILPRMGYFMGVLPMDSVGVDFIEPSVKNELYNNPNILRKEKTISEKEWKAIRDFYIKHAPEKLVENNEIEIKKEMPNFKVKFPPHYLSPPSSTMVKFTEKNKLYLGDFHTSQLYVFDENMELKNRANLSPGVVDLTESEEGLVVTSIGSFSPTDMPIGSVSFLSKNENIPARILVDSLRRPVCAELADLDLDGRFDLIISEFGKWTGGLSWWKNNGKGSFEKNILRNMPGAVRTKVQDLNGDNLPDVVALFAQGDEGIFIFWNKGNGEFAEERMLRFPPSYGSSYFDLFDYNGDGFFDIIYTCGDNADFPPINKPYHGIYIFENDGENNFEQSFFYPLNGAYCAIPADFNQDGNMDIAAISFFPDFKNKPESSFVYLKGKKRIPENLEDFTTHTFPQYNKGRWIVMDAGDLEGDGDIDIVLGSLAFETIPDNGEVAQWTRDGIPFVILENTIR